MIVTRLQRRRRAAIAKIAVAATLAVLVLTPRLDTPEQGAKGLGAVSAMALSLSSPPTPG